MDNVGVLFRIFCSQKELNKRRQPYDRITNDHHLPSDSSTVQGSSAVR